MTWKRFFKSLVKDIKVFTTTLDKYGNMTYTETANIEGYLQKETTLLQNEKGETTRAEYTLWTDEEIKPDQVLGIEEERYKVIESKVISIYSPFFGNEIVYKYYLKRVS